MIGKEIIPVPGTSNINHLKENINIQNFNINEEDLKIISSLNYKNNIRLIKNQSKYKW